MPEDFADIVREHQAMVFRTLTRMLGHTDAVPDLAQEVFLRLHRALPQFGHHARLSTYLYRIVVNVAQDEWKRRRRPEYRAASLSDPDTGLGDRLADHAPTAQAVLERRELQAAVDTLLEQLPPAERAALVLFHQEGRRYDEIAAVLDVPVNTVRTHLHRGRSRLARLLRERLGRDDV
jgi:RNA polymerase sigma-70 factor (ECF subfamily)